MKSSTEDSDQPSLSSAKPYGPLAVLYKNVLSQFKESKTSRNYGKIWSSVAPSGNIYRYLGLNNERLKHCWDIRRQLADLAEDKKDLLGSELSQKKRIDLLLSALNGTKAEGGVDSEAGEKALKGFLPLQEFGTDEVGCVAFMYYPKDPAELSRWRYNHFVAFLVFVIQTLGVILLFIQLWDRDDNQLKHPNILWNSFSARELLCLGKDTSAALTTLEGVMFLLLVCGIVYNYAKDELDNAEKAGRLPLCKFWSTISTCTNALCGIVILVATPLELWGEDGICGLMMSSMAMLFVFALDDLTGDVFGYVGADDCDFAKMVSWHYSLLSYCPINIRDLVDDNETDLKNLWKIKYGQNGILMSARTCERCETRLIDVTPEATEKSRLVQEEISEGDLEGLVVEYCTHYTGELSAKERLPGMRATLLKIIWTFTTWAIKILWIAIPLVWFVVNKPCY